MARDWSKLRAASFRGVPFRVDGEQPETGRTVVKHRVSGGESHPTEDMGKAVEMISVDAYVIGNDADGAGLALEAACRAVGAAMLQLPIDAPLMAHCEICRRDRRKDANGMIVYTLEFTPYAPMPNGAASGTGALQTIVTAAATSLGAAMAGLF